VTAETALRLARYLGTSERSWLNRQAGYELEAQKDRLGDRLAKEVRVLAAAKQQEMRVSACAGRPGWAPSIP